MKKVKDINLIIKDKRGQLGLTQEELSESCSMTESEYRDIEDYDDELYMVVPLYKVACICNLLSVSLEGLYGFSSQNSLISRDIISKKLQEKDLTVLELSDLVGIEESFIKAIIKDIVNIGDWVMDPIVTLSEKLELNLGSVLESFFEYSQQSKTLSRT